VKRIICWASFVTLSAAPAFATIVPVCQGAHQAIVTRQEEAWISRCAATQQKDVAAAKAEKNCREWLEACRRRSPMRPGFMTF